MKGIVTADWHLRATMPRCRRDENWNETQKKCLRQVLNISETKKCPIFVVGDLFHSLSDTSFECIQMIQNIAKESNYGIYILAGNHDLPYHSTENIDRSAVGILMKSSGIYSILNYFEDTDEDVSACNFDEETENAEIIFKHVLCFPDVKSLPPNVDAITAKELLSEYNKSKWIFTGDYHHSFHYENKGRHVVNPGCLIRQVSDMKDYQCSVFYVDTDNEIVERIPIIDKEEFVDDSYIIQEKEKEERIEQFANKLKETKNVSLDFIENIEQAVLQNNLSDELKETINELLEV